MHEITPERIEQIRADAHAEHVSAWRGETSSQTSRGLRVKTAIQAIRDGRGDDVFGLLVDMMSEAGRGARRYLRDPKTIRATRTGDQMIHLGLLRADLYGYYQTELGARVIQHVDQHPTPEPADVRAERELQEQEYEVNRADSRANGTRYGATKSGTRAHVLTGAVGLIADCDANTTRYVTTAWARQNGVCQRCQPKRPGRTTPPTGKPDAHTTRDAEPTHD